MKRYYYNKLGQLRLAKDALDTWTYFKYDGLGRITQQGVYTGNPPPNPDSTAWTDSTFPTSYTSQVITKKYDSYDTGVWSSYGVGVQEPKGPVDSSF